MYLVQRLPGMFARLALSSLFGLVLLGAEPGLAANKTWLSGGGANATNWNRGANWSPAGAPGSADDIIIPTTPANGTGFPVLNATSTIASLTIQSGASLTGASGFNLTVSGNVSITSTGVLNVNASTITVGGAITGTGTVNGNTSTLNVGGNMTVTTFTAGTSTVVYNGTGAQTAGGAYTYNNLTINKGGGTATLGGATTVNGTLTLTSGTLAVGANTLTLNGPAIAGTPSNLSTTSSSSLSFGGTAAGVSVPSSVTQLNNLTINNGNGITLNSSPTINGTLTLSAGVVSTGANTLITTANCPGSVARTSGHVAGFLRLQVPTGSPTCTFDVGDSTTYRPMNLTFSSVTTAGNLAGSVSQSAGDHPNISTSGLDATQSVNRFWTLTNSGIALSSYNATFNFVAGDVDAGADTAQFEVERWDGTSWSTTTAGTRTATSTQATGITSFSDFAVAKKKPAAVTPSSYNAFETSTSAGAITGVIKTKIAGASFSLDVVAIAGGAQLAGFTDQVIVELLGNNSLGVPLDAQNCPTSFTLVQTVSPNPTITGGRSTVNFAAVPNSWRDVRVRVRWPTSSPTVTGCSTDNFAIRPNAFSNFSVTDNDAQTAGTGRTLNDTAFGTVTHKAGRPFSVRATAVNAAGTPATTTNYSESPSTTITTCSAGAGTEACTVSFGTLSLNTTFSSGQLVSDVATYGEVGSFQLQLVDSAFSSVDASDGSTAAERNIVSSTINVGRFVPDHFAVSLNTPVFGTACSAGTFSYVGQAFNYTVQPVVTVTAQDFGNSTTMLYAGSWWRITNSSLTGKSYTAAAGTVDTSGLPGTDPVIAPAGSGTGTLTFSSGTGLLFTRTAPVAPFDAEIRLEINVLDSDGVAASSNPIAFGAASPGNGISFNNGKQMRFGRLQLGNANGSQLINLRVPLEAQHWNGTSFLTNTADSCTAIGGASIALSNYTQNLNACETSVSISGSFSSGRGNLQLTAPGNANNGGVVLTVNLGASGSGSTCIAGASTPVTGANKPFLQGNWTGGAYDQNPAARATFGVYKGSEEFIYFRENF